VLSVNPAVEENIENKIESKRGQGNNCLRGEVLQNYLIIH
jgi:hypothetical protein